MPTPSISEQIQSARATCKIAAQLATLIHELQDLDAQRQSGTFQPDQLTPAQLEALGLIDPAQLNKLLDEAANLQNAHDLAVQARGLAG